MVRQRQLTAMGGAAHLIVHAASARTARAALDAATARIAVLEQRWSRFQPDNELALLARAAGRAVAVSHDTRLLVACCLRAWRFSGGRFDATVLDALERLGYDRSFSCPPGSPLPDLASIGGRGTPGGPIRHGAGTASGTARTRGGNGISLDARTGTAAFPAGVRLDPGGLGKGLAADLASAAGMAAGALGACVNLAGDVRARGAAAPPTGPAGDGDPAASGRWVVGVEHPLNPGKVLDLVTLPRGGGAVASSSVLLRRWGPGSHHIIDPARGIPAQSPVVAVTTIATKAVWADAATKIALVEPDPEVSRTLLTRLGFSALLVLADGTELRTGPSPGR